jgi:hypothetical protein
VAISGDTAIVGASSESSNATGVNGNQSNNSAPGSGAAYVFARSGTVWSQQAYLKASNTNAGDSFGFSVAVSGDTAIVGAPVEASNATGVNGNQSDNSASFSGAAYVFVRNGAAWTQQAYFKASNTESNDEFGRNAVAISGNTAIVGAWHEDSNATGINGNQSNNSAADAGAAYVFTLGETLEFVTSVSPAAPPRSDAGWVGMHLAVGDAPLVVSALGRYCVAGNSQAHTVKLVSANTKNDVPNATASVNMSGCTPGQFVYADLGTAVTLTAEAHYYLISQEGNGDQWLDLGPVTLSLGASVVGSVYYNNVLWITAGAAGTSYVPPSMKYEIQDVAASSAFILSYNLDNRVQRNNFTGFVGMQLRVGSAALTVNSVGRACIPGNSQTHTVKFVNAATGADIPGGSAVVNMAGCGTDFVYQTLASPIVLQADTIYYLVSAETIGGDKWTDQSQLTTSSDAQVLTSIYSLGSGYATNEAYAAYAPPNFLYTK